MVNAGQRCWKACWGQPLASSNLASSATLTCDDALGSCSRAALHPKARVSFPVSVEPWPYVVFRTNRCGGTLNDSRCTWSGTSRTYLNGTAHAAEACTPTVHGRPRPSARSSRRTRTDPAFGADPTLVRALCWPPRMGCSVAFSAAAVSLALDLGGRIWLSAKRCVWPRQA